nr:hypothetical protein CFP56_36263 [Quercus suber]
MSVVEAFEKYALILHAHVFATAVMYQVPGLQTLSVTKFKEAVHHLWSLDSFADAIRVVYTTTADHVMDLRVIVENVLIRHSELLEKSNFQAVLIDHPILSLAIARRIFRAIKARIVTADMTKSQSNADLVKPRTVAVSLARHPCCMPTGPSTVANYDLLIHSIEASKLIRTNPEDSVASHIDIEAIGISGDDDVPTRNGIEAPATLMQFIAIYACAVSPLERGLSMMCWDRPIFIPYQQSVPGRNASWLDVFVSMHTPKNMHPNYRNCSELAASSSDGVAKHHKQLRRRRSMACQTMASSIRLCGRQADVPLEADQMTWTAVAATTTSSADAPDNSSDTQDLDPSGHTSAHLLHTFEASHLTTGFFLCRNCRDRVYRRLFHEPSVSYFKVYNSWQILSSTNNAAAFVATNGNALHRRVHISHEQRTQMVPPSSAPSVSQEHESLVPPQRHRHAAKLPRPSTVQSPARARDRSEVCKVGRYVLELRGLERHDGRHCSTACRLRACQRTARRRLDRCSNPALERRGQPAAQDALVFRRGRGLTHAVPTHRPASPPREQASKPPVDHGRAVPVVQVVAIVKQNPALGGVPGIPSLCRFPHGDPQERRERSRKHGDRDLTTKPGILADRCVSGCSALSFGIFVTLVSGFSLKFFLLMWHATSRNVMRRHSCLCGSKASTLDCSAGQRSALLAIDNVVCVTSARARAPSGTWFRGPHPHAYLGCPSLPSVSDRLAAVMQEFVRYCLLADRSGGCQRDAPIAAIVSDGAAVMRGKSLRPWKGLSRAPDSSNVCVPNHRGM